MPRRPSQHLTAVLQAVFVTVLWASSWVLIKLGLRAELPALTFAGLRYVLAFLCLLPLILLNPANRSAIRSLAAKDWSRLAVLGLVFYTLTQGSQFLSLAYLPAAMVSLLLNLTPLVVALFGIFFLREHPTPRQWLGLALTILGVAIFFFPLDMPGIQTFGLLVAVAGVITNAASSLLGRQVNRRAGISPLIVTFISMGIGSVMLLSIGALSQGFGALDLQGWLLIGWLAVVNTAFAFTLWNHTLRTLTAVESSIINSLMMPQIAILAFVFLDESLRGREIVGLVLVSLGVLIVQLRRQEPRRDEVPSISPGPD
ncbi:MAG TPA: DMT family transporter [Anaerolineales bacterium]|nr:DMT family transporter [Anaerolineales bacterium]